MTERRWAVKLTGPARRALEKDLPESVAWAAYTFLTERLAVNPHRVGKPLAEPYEALHSAQLGTYRVIYRINEAAHAVEVIAIRLRGDVYGVR